MGDTFRAAVQYGDMKGTVSIDGWQGPPIQELAEGVRLKKGFIPIGFGFYQLHPNKNGKIPIKIYAADSAEVGVTGGEMKAYSEKHGNLPVVGFTGEIEPTKLKTLFKRFCMRLHTNWLDLEPEEIDIVDYHYYEDDPDYEDDEE